MVLVDEKESGHTPPVEVLPAILLVRPPQEHDVHAGDRRNHLFRLRFVEVKSTVPHLSHRPTARPRKAAAGRIPER